MTVPPPLLEVRGFEVAFHGDGPPVRAVNGASFEVAPGERVGLVGESGSGKTVTALGAMGLLASPPARVSGEIRFGGADLLRLRAAERRGLRGARMAMVFQNPLNSLNPAMTVGAQIAEAIRAHRKLPKPAARRAAMELLASVGIPAPERTVDEYPHRLSGGMRQRAMIAMALSCDPELLIADEPTTALDVRVQAQIVELLATLAEERGMAVLLITHDLALLAGFAERIVVMHSGRVMEQAPVESIYYGASHPYTWGLMASIPRLDRPPARPALATSRASSNSRSRPGSAPAAAELLRVDGLVKRFPITRGAVLRRTTGFMHAVDGVSFSLAEGETLGLVGESGAGKSTVARCVLRLIEPTAGRIVFRGLDVRSRDGKELRRLRRDMQIVFQDPYESLNPRMEVEALVAEPLLFHRLAAGRREAARRIAGLLDLVGLSSEHARRYPRELSGGERQRVAIARAVASRPRLLVLDEPVSALDVSIRAQVLELLAGLQSELGLSYLLIAHDLALVRHVSHRVAVMRDGRIVEAGDRDALFHEPRHPYTRELLAAVPVPDPRAERRRRRYRLPGGASQRLSKESTSARRSKWRS